MFTILLVVGGQHKIFTVMILLIIVEVVAIEGIG